MVQRDVMNFADRFAGNMADTYDELAARSPSPAAKNAALERKIGNVSAAYVNASASNPIVGLIDMIVTVTLLRRPRKSRGSPSCTAPMPRRSWPSSRPRRPTSGTSARAT